MGLADVKTFSLGLFEDQLGGWFGSGYRSVLVRHSALLLSGLRFGQLTEISEILDCRSFAFLNCHDLVSFKSVENDRRRTLITQSSH